MRVVIAVPPIHDFYCTSHRMSALGTEVLKAGLQKNGHSVIAMNFPADNTSQQVVLPIELLYMRPFIISGETGPLSYFLQYRRFGGESPMCARKIIEVNPDIVCISLFAWAYAREAVELADEIKLLRPQLSVIFGGSGVSAFPEYFIKKQSVDFVIAGEGEESLPILLEAIKSGTEEQLFQTIPGLFWRKGTEVFSSNQPAKLAARVTPAIVPTKIIKGRQFYSVSIARGCPKKCRFCTNYIVQGRRFRKSSLESIKQRLLELKNDYMAPPSPFKPHFNFEDDNLLVDSEYFISVMEVFKELFPNSSFSAENGLDYQLMTCDMVEKLYSFGFSQLNLSLASVSDSILKKQGRRSSRSLYESLVKKAAELSLPCITYFIAGFEQDTPELIAATLAYLALLPTRIGISPFYAVPGLPGFQDFDKFENLPPGLCLGSSMYPWNNSLSTKTLVTAFRLARLINVIKEGRWERNVLWTDLITRSFLKKSIFTIKKEKKTKKINLVCHLDNEILQCFFQRCPNIESLLPSP